VFLLRWLRDPIAERGAFLLGLLTSALLLCRLDLGILVAPMLATSLWPLRRGRIARFALGLSPFVAWELFSLVYYGLLVPNTALAKLPPGVPLWDLMTQGARYFQATFHFDTFTPIVMVSAFLVMITFGQRAGRVIAAGVLLHLLYVVCVGGDFMTGRFLTPAFVVAVAGALATVRLPRGATPRLAAAALLIGATQNPAGPLRTGASFGPIGDRVEDRHGVTDERRVYYPSLGLLPVWNGLTTPAQHPSAQFAANRRAEQRNNDAIITSVIGVAGYYAGPSIHIVDRYALADPLLSRLPPKPGWRIGHFERELPSGYLESCQRRENVIEDVTVKALYADVLLVTRAPLFGAGRFGAMWRLF
jgi:arabinofuranosyltransferase